MYKPHAKHYLLLKSPVHIPRYCELKIPVTRNSTYLMNAINNLLNGVGCYYITATVIVRIEVLTCDTIG